MSQDKAVLGGGMINTTIVALAAMLVFPEDSVSFNETVIFWLYAVPVLLSSITISVDYFLNGRTRGNGISLKDVLRMLLWGGNSGVIIWLLNISVASVLRVSNQFGPSLAEISTQILIMVSMTPVIFLLAGLLTLLLMPVNLPLLYYAEFRPGSEEITNPRLLSGSTKYLLYTSLAFLFFVSLSLGVMKYRGTFNVNIKQGGEPVASEPDYDGWFEAGHPLDDDYHDVTQDNVDNYQSTLDLTHRDRVTVYVGIDTDEHPYEPPAILIEPGTTVVWKWSYADAAHDVVTQSGEPLKSDQTQDRSYTYSHTFNQASTKTKYYCTPHTSSMRGLVITTGS